MSDRNPRDRKPPFRRPGGKPFDKGRPAGGHAAGRRLAEDNIKAPIAPEIVRPSQIDQLLGPDAVHQGLLAEADPLPSPDIEALETDGMVLVLDQITDPHNVGAIMRSAAAFAIKAIVTTARHSPEATG